jgi:hypothetical protein
MSDVLQTAMKYQSQIKSEMTKVNDFIQMAEAFLKKSEPKNEPSDSIKFFTASSNSGSNSASQKKSAADGPRSVSGGAGTA